MKRTQKRSKYDFKKVSGIFRFKLIMKLSFVDNCKVAFGSRCHHLIGSRSRFSNHWMTGSRKFLWKFNKLIIFKEIKLDYGGMLTTLRRLVLCVVTFHQRSCLIPYPIDGKVSRHQFLPHHFPGLLRVWGWTTKLLIVQSNYKFTNLFLAIQCVVLSLNTIFFLESTCEGLE